MNIIKLSTILLFSLMLLGCIEEKISDNSIIIKGSNSNAISRSIAERYELMKKNGISEACYKEPDKTSDRVALLTNKSQVRLVSKRTGLISNKGQHWIHIVLQNGLSCFVDIQHLIPVPEY